VSDAGGSVCGLGPPIEGELHGSVTKQESCFSIVVDNDGSIGQVVIGGVPSDSIVGPDQATALRMPLAVQPLVELGSQERCRVRYAGGDGVAVFVVVSPAAGGTWAVASGEGDSVIKEEQRCPAARASKGDAPASELGLADDPQLAAVVADDVFVAVDYAAAISGEQTTSGFGVEITPGVDSVASRRSSDRVLTHRAAQDCRIDRDASLALVCR